MYDKNLFDLCQILCLILGITLVCGGLSSCGSDESLDDPLTAEEMQVIDLYDGDNIYFTIGTTIYEGHVVEGVSKNEVRVLLDDGSDMVISVDRIGGTLLADHPDIGVEVVLMGDRDKGEKLLQGEVTKVYTDGKRKIEIFAIGFMDGGGERLEVPHIRFVHEDTDFKDGGYLTLEEFAEWLDN